MVAIAIRIILSLAALVATPVSVWLQNNGNVSAIVGAVAALLALFLTPPHKPAALPDKSRDL